MQEYCPEEYCQEVRTGAILNEVSNEAAQINTDTKDDNKNEIYFNQSLGRH